MEASSVAASQLVIEDEQAVDSPNENTNRGAQTSAELTLGASGIEVGNPLEEADALPARKASTVDTVGGQSGSLAPAQERDIADSDVPVPAPVESGNAGDGDESLAKNELVAARAADDFDVASGQSRSQPSPQERDSADSDHSLQAPIEDGNSGDGESFVAARVAEGLMLKADKLDPSRRLKKGQSPAQTFPCRRMSNSRMVRMNFSEVASRSIGLEDNDTSSKEPTVSEASTQPNASDSNTVTTAHSGTILYTELLLDRLGFDPGPIDVVIEPKTKEAILAFQKLNGGEATGDLDDELIAAVENKLFAAFEQYLETKREQGTKTPSVKKATQPTKTAAPAPSGDQQPRKIVMHYPQKVPPNKVESIASAPKTSVSGRRTKQPAIQPAIQSEVQEAAIREQPIFAQPPYEKIVEEVQQDRSQRIRSLRKFRRLQELCESRHGLCPV